MSPFLLQTTKLFELLIDCLMSSSSYTPHPLARTIPCRLVFIRNDMPVRLQRWQKAGVKYISKMVCLMKILSIYDLKQFLTYDWYIKTITIGLI